ncbi:MAG TPA: phospholipase D-like domain-containing protein [Blastocatellia bacterium]|nr:phospholipase D-like domain-containing protein [Blastocatellia bacterium]
MYQATAARFAIHGSLSFIGHYYAMNAYTQVHNLSLIIQPGDSFFPIVSAIDSAKQNIKMTIFRMDDPIVRDALRLAVSREVKVKALVAPTSKGWTSKNKKLVDELSALGVDVRVPRPRKEKLKRYHYKMMMIDNAQSLILTFNPTQDNLHYARDFGVLIRDEEITSELNRLFDADWNGEKFDPAELPLVTSPFNSRKKLLELIASAERSVQILDAKVEDQQFLSLLLRKAAAGCSVKIIGRDTEYNGVVSNFQIRTLARFRLHAKCIVVDNTRFFVGSQNLRSQSLDERREVGIIVEDEATSRKISRVFDEDWEKATALKTEAEPSNA